MSVYIKDIPLNEALNLIKRVLQEVGLWKILSCEKLPLDENLIGRVTADPVWAIKSSPHYHASAMDGFTVDASKTNGALPTNPKILIMGEDASYVDTGDPIPDWANAVIPIENVESIDSHGRIFEDSRKPEALRIRSSIVPWSNIRPMGEDIVTSQLVLPSGHVLEPYDLGAIAASGSTTVSVAKLPVVGILPTGSELVPIGNDPQKGDILEYNSLVIAAQIKLMGGSPTRYPITPDDFDKICQRVIEVAEASDLVLLNAGSSAGSEDFSAKVVEKLGKLLFHGVAVRPGHPVIFGMIRKTRNPEDLREIPIIGVPGYPVSAALTIDIFVEPIIAQWLGRSQKVLPTLKAQITRKTSTTLGDDDYIRVVVGRVGEKLLAAPISRGAGVITSLVRADGLVILPRGVEGVNSGEIVTAHMFRNKSEIDDTIFCIGSHDVILDLIAQFLAPKKRRFISSNVGSQAGLIALNRGEAHMAGSHLLDPETGEYNLRYIGEYLSGIPVKLVGLVTRDQGLIVKKGNPLKIRSLEDLVNKDVSFVNRQRGAGTRVLLDFQLNLKGMTSSMINGYEIEEYTHLGVAAAIASGRADCGLGIPAAAQALNLDFIPLYKERYDLVIPTIYADSILFEPIFELLNSTDFSKAINELPGYDTSSIGNIIFEVK